MNKRTSSDIYFGRKSLQFFYLRYKDSAYYTLSVIVVIIIMCVLLVLYFIIPLYDQWFSIRSEVIATRMRTAIIDENTAYLSRLDKNLLNAQTGIVSTALPPEKNFGAILSALTRASIRSGVSFQDYSFQIGSVSSEKGHLENTRFKGLSSVKISIVLDGTVGEVRGFIQEVTKTLPLSEVTSIEGSTGAITVTMEFYQKSLPKTTLKDDQPLPRVVESNAIQINQLSSWQVVPASETTAPQASGSAGPVPLF